MAEKRMFAKTIVLSDAFLDMPMSARCLYFTLGMMADDDGFVSSPKAIMRQCGASQDDLNILVAKRYVLLFESGVIVIKHWRINNYLRQDRYIETTYLEEKSMLTLDGKGAYTERDGRAGIPPGIPVVDHLVYPDKDSIEKNSIDQDSIENNACAEQPETIVCTLLLNDGTEYQISDVYINQMQQLFPNVDVWQQMLKMKAWCINNPRRRKTRRGITAFINSWLSKEQDRGGPVKQAAPRRQYTTAAEYTPPKPEVSPDELKRLTDQI